MGCSLLVADTSDIHPSGEDVCPNNLLLLHFTQDIKPQITPFCAEKMQVLKGFKLNIKGISERSHKAFNILPLQEENSSK